MKLFIRFAIAKGAVTYGLELMMALFKIVQGMKMCIRDSQNVILEVHNGAFSTHKKKLSLIHIFGSPAKAERGTGAMAV